LLVSAVVISVTIYTMTLEKQNEIALLKLIGSPNGPIVSMILQQALALGALGYGIAVLLGPLIWPLFPRRLVQPSQDFLMFAAIVLVLCGLGAVLGIWKAMQVEAREVLS
jgi:putative ABC transport system permease protein